MLSLNSLRRYAVCLIPAVWIAVAAAGAGAQSSTLADLPLVPDIARIVERGTLVVAQIDADLPQVFATAEDGTLSGFDVDLARTMARLLGVELEIVRTAESYDEVVRQVALGQADLGVSFLSRTPRRAKYVLFSRPYLSQSFTLLVNRVKGLRFRNNCPTVQELLEKAEYAGMLAIEAGSANLARVLEINPDAKVREFDTTKETMDAVLAGDVAISLQGELAAGLYLKNRPAARIRLQVCRVGSGNDDIAVAVQPGRHDLLHWVNAFLDDYGVRVTVRQLIDHEGPWLFGER